MLALYRKPHAFLTVAVLALTACTESTSEAPAAPTPDTTRDEVWARPDTSAPSPADTSAPSGEAQESDTLATDTGPDGEEPEETSEPSEDAPEACDCQGTVHCDPVGECVDDVCLEGQTTCASLDALLVCNADGSASETLPCPDDEICYLGGCQEPICSASSDPPYCEDGMRMVCNSLGLAYVAIPCPSNTECVEGDCIPLRANMILVVDTSGSMSLLYEDSSTYPSECFGAGCPPWTFPNCDDSSNPLTRIGRTKQALHALVTNNVASSVRLALQRFPQTGTPFPNCKHGYYSDQKWMTGDTQSTQAELTWFTPGLQEIMAVPFSPTTSENDTAALLAWMDFTETIASTGTSCIFGTDCPSGICDNGVCQEHDNPELRGIGATPLGKSLFYAGEYLRHFVLVEGQPCGTDSDCGSPNHTCVEGACHDPYAECRPTSIILFTDGIETVNDDPATFFHPRVQAKRLHFGLGCGSDADCLNEATCVSGICEPPAWLGLPEKQCNSITMACDSNADCPDFNCGKSLPCPGKCETTAIGVTSPAANHIKDYQGNPLPITIHVVDASGYANGNALIATYGGGEHVSVAFDDLDQLVSQLTTLFDTKDDSPCGSSANGSP